MKKQDEEAKARVETRNKFENYVYTVRSSLTDPAVSEKFSNSDKSELESAVADTMSWLDANQSASKDEFEFRMSELEKKVNPIMTKMHRGGATSEGPSVEELD